MITDRDCIQAILDLYNGATEPWADLLWPAADDGVCFGLRRIGDDDLVVFRGSVTAQDWARDFMAIPHQPGSHPQLGDVHLGFMQGLDTALAHLQPLLRAKVTIAGHSLGAARATLFCGLLIAWGLIPMARVVFGEPRSGCDDLTNLLRVIPHNVSYRNADIHGHDLVTDVPTSPPFNRVTPLIDVYAPPPPNDSWGLLAYHHAYLYQNGLNSINPV